MEYLEHEKLHKVSKESQIIGDFLDDCGYALGEWVQGYGAFGDEFMPLRKPINAVLAEYFEIELDKIESEKRAMLEELSTLQPKAS